MRPLAIKFTLQTVKNPSLRHQVQWIPTIPNQSGTLNYKKPTKAPNRLESDGGFKVKSEYNIVEYMIIYQSIL